VITHEHTIGHHGNYRSDSSANSDLLSPADIHLTLMPMILPNRDTPRHYSWQSVTSPCRHSTPSAVSCAEVTACVGPNYRRKFHLSAPPAVLAPLSCMFWLTIRWSVDPRASWVGFASDPFDISSSLQVASWRSQRFGCCNLDHFEVKGHLPSSLHHQRQHHHHRLVSYDDDHQVPGIRRTRTTIEIRGPSRIRRLWIFESAGSLCIATTPSLSRPSVYVSHPSRQPRNLELELELELHNWSYYYRPESFKLQVAS
jgi:hypothetical protein